MHVTSLIQSRIVLLGVGVFNPSLLPTLTIASVDFTFFISTGPSGIALHDIRFKEDRIVYELGMQEALAHYAGPNCD